MKRLVTSLRVALGLFVGLLSLVGFLCGFFVWLSPDEFMTLNRPGIALVIMIPISTALLWGAWRLVVGSFNPQRV